MASRGVGPPRRPAVSPTPASLPSRSSPDARSAGPDDDAPTDARPADARFFAEPAERWTESIDGRFASVGVATGDALELVTDPVGAYPLYEAAVNGTRWFSNSAAALRELTGDTGCGSTSLAGLVGGGWPLDGHPIWNGIERSSPARPCG